jgi:hypothetical protein
MEKHSMETLEFVYKTILATGKDVKAVFVALSKFRYHNCPEETED